MHAYDMRQLIENAGTGGKAYYEFLRAPDLSAGLYQLAAGSVDPQSPHGEDEVYFVVSGRGSIRVADEDQAVAAGSVVYVPKGVEHKFHTIHEELTLLVFFAPAEYSSGGASVDTAHAG